MIRIKCVHLSRATPKMHTKSLNHDMNIYRHANGILLANSNETQQKYSRFNKTNHTVASILQLPFNVYFLDLNSVIQCQNEIATQVCGFESENDSIGRTVKDILKKESAEYMISNDRMVINSNKIHVTDDSVLRFDEKAYTALSIKCPWYDNNHNTIGIFGCSIILNEQSLSASLLQISQLGLLSPHQALTNPHTFMPGKQINNIYLSKRETEVAQYLIHGKTAKDISKILFLSQRTVEKHLEHIKIKMKVKTKSELIEMLIMQVQGK